MKMFSTIFSLIIILYVGRSSSYMQERMQLIADRVRLIQTTDITQDRSDSDYLKGIPNFLQTYPEVLENILQHRNDSRCYDDWQVIQSYASPFDVFKFWDSYGVPATGILEGHLLHPGQPQECFDAKSGYTGIKNTSFPDTEMFLVKLANISLGVCMPSSCSIEEVSSIFENEERPNVITLGREKFNADAGFVIGVFVFGTILLLTIIATSRGAFLKLSEIIQNMTDNYKATELGNEYNVQDEPNRDNHLRQKSQETSLPVKMLMCFDFYANMCKILSIPKTSNQDQLSVLNGMRVLSLGWVMIGHLSLLQLGVMDNFIYVLERTENMLFQTITNSFASVDTFFVMSGCLVMMGTLRTLDKFEESKGKFGNFSFWILFYVHRLIRLWPALLLTILFVAGIYPNLAPLFYSPKFQNTQTSSMSYQCKGTRWISTGFFYNNWISDPEVMCLAWSWYIPNDVQFYFLSPLFILLARCKLILSVAAIGFCLLVNTLTVLLASGMNDVPPSDNGFPILGRLFFNHDKTFDLTGTWRWNTYVAFYCRFQTYGIGLLLGLVLYQKEHVLRLLRRFIYPVRLLIICAIWVLAFVAGILNVYGCYFWANGYPMGVWSVAFYNATMRILWGVFISVIVFMSSTGYGGIIEKILGAKFWIPFARVNYTTYVIHFVLLELYVQTLETVFHFTTIEYALIASGMLMCINCLSILISCFIEAPFIQMEKVILGDLFCNGHQYFGKKKNNSDIRSLVDK
ncbi:nose resistant to fluoxetine protein 6-like isoform X2 [Convolutriloba macropyga]|uniref:nose resistant to fluoxetine protein 6-like isoform X2 n=1 Tax=Convolutriloba macropyga TaxID=536237 RepID=UPI003F51B624